MLDHRELLELKRWNTPTCQPYFNTLALTLDFRFGEARRQPDWR